MVFPLARITSPESSGSLPIIIFRTVVFPAPLTPTGRFFPFFDMKGSVGYNDLIPESFFYVMTCQYHVVSPCKNVYKSSYYSPQNIITEKREK